MRSEYLLKQAKNFWNMSQKMDINAKQELLFPSMDQKLLTTFTGEQLEKENQELIQQTIKESFNYFNEFQKNPKTKAKLQIDTYLLEKIKLQLQIMNENYLFLDFPLEINSIERFGVLQVYGLNINRDENKYFNDYEYTIQENTLVFEEKAEFQTQKKLTKSEEMREGMKEMIEEDTRQLPFLNRQVQKVFELFGQKYEPPRDSNFTDDVSKNYSKFKSSMYEQSQDYILIEDYIVKTLPLKMSNSDELLDGYTFLLRSERLKYGKGAKSIKKFTRFQITDLDFLCGGNPPAYLKSYL